MNKNEVTTKSKLRVLIVEDDQQVAQLLRLYLERDGHTVLIATNGAEGLAIARSEDPSIVLLDLMLPEMDGREVCRRIRLNSDMPIIMVTARVEEHDRLKGLGLGADDYVSKPFSPSELVARIYAVMRRFGQGSNRKTVQETDDLKFEPLTISSDKRDASINGDWVGLTQTEFELLLKLARSHGTALTREHLLRTVLGQNSDSNDRTLDVHLSNLRHKIGKNQNQQSFIKAVYGMGYKFNP